LCRLKLVRLPEIEATLDVHAGLLVRPSVRAALSIVTYECYAASSNLKRSLKLSLRNEVCATRWSRKESTRSLWGRSGRATCSGRSTCILGDKTRVKGHACMCLQSWGCQLVVAKIAIAQPSSCLLTMLSLTKAVEKACSKLNCFVDMLHATAHFLCAFVPVAAAMNDQHVQPVVCATRSETSGAEPSLSQAHQWESCALGSTIQAPLPIGHQA